MPGNPQIEDGFVKIATELHAALCRFRIPGEANLIFHAIIHKTYGFNKREDRISLSQFEEMTGLSRAHVCRALSLLLLRNLIAKSGTATLKKYRINKLYATWRVVPKAGLPKRGLPKSARGVVPKAGHTIETFTKDILVNKSTDVIPSDVHISLRSTNVKSKVLNEFETFILWLNGKKIFPNEKQSTDLAARKWKARRLKYPARKIAEAFLNLVNEPDRWKIENNGHRPLAWWLHSDERIEEMLSCHLKKFTKARPVFNANI